MSTSGEWPESGAGPNQWPQHSPSGGWAGAQPGAEAGGADGAAPSGPDGTTIGVIVGLVCVVLLAAGIGYLLITDDGGSGGGDEVATDDEPGANGSDEGNGGPTPGPLDDVGGDTIPVRDLQIGDCFEFPDQDEVSEITPRDCRVDHSAEVYAEVDLGEYADENEPWRGRNTVGEWSRDLCDPHFEDFIGIPREDSELVGQYFMPTVESWSSGDRQVTCFVVDEAGPVRGTLEGAAR